MKTSSGLRKSHFKACFSNSAISFSGFLLVWELGVSAWPLPTGHLSRGMEGVTQNQNLPLDLNPHLRWQHKVAEEHDLELEFDAPWLWTLSLPFLFCKMSQRALTDRAAVRMIGHEIQKVPEHCLVRHGSLRALPCPFLPIDFPVPVSGSLVSPNYSSVFSSSLGWDISHGGGLTVPQSARGGLGRWPSDNKSVSACMFFVGFVLVVSVSFMSKVLARMRLWDFLKSYPEWWWWKASERWDWSCVWIP